MTLNAVTGIQGLFARCALPPGVPPPSASSSSSSSSPASSSRLTMGWHNSTALPGYTWEGDTSSDEVAGHAMAYTVAQQWLAPAGGDDASSAAATLLHLTRYVVGNNFTLVDVTGKPTTWGRWDPAEINWGRDWSDERGLNAVEMLAMLAGAAEAVAVPNSGGAGNDTAAFAAATTYLMSPGVDYGGNMVNAKIIAPDDDNYSDDELLYFSYFPVLLATEGPVGKSEPYASARAAALASLARTWSLISFSRPSLWNILSLRLLGANASGAYANLPGGGGGGGGRRRRAASAAGSAGYFAGARLSSSSPSIPLPDPAQALADSLWDLRTWPIETVDWPTLNSVRQDISLDPEVDRDFNRATQSRNVLPGNERSMFRWNSNPRELDGGGGQSSTDPGAYLMPYWLARAFGLLAAAPAAAAAAAAE